MPLPLSVVPNVFDADAPAAPIRKGFGEGLVEAGTRDHQVVALCADLTESTMMHLFAKAFPERYLEIGIAEQNLASVASGLAAMGKVPFFSSYAMFSPGRNWEQIRTTICYNNVNAKIVGSHAGVSVGPDGGTHQAIEDLALMRVLPRMIVVAPCDAVEAKKATLALAQWDGPAYVRLAREATTILTTEEAPFSIGVAQVLWEARTEPKLGIISTGGLTVEALKAAKMLEESGIPTTLLHVATVKPLDEEAICALAERAGTLVVAEEHQVAGGLGSAVAELLASRRPTPIEFVGVRDQYGQSGTPAELLAHYRLDAPAIVEAGQRAVQRKR